MIGKSVPRVDAYEKVTGRAKFTDDLDTAQMSRGKSSSCNDWKWNCEIYRYK